MSDKYLMSGKASTQWQTMNMGNMSLSSGTKHCQYRQMY